MNTENEVISIRIGASDTGKNDGRAAMSIEVLSGSEELMPNHGSGPTEAGVEVILQMLTYAIVSIIESKSGRSIGVDKLTKKVIREMETSIVEGDVKTVSESYGKDDGFAGVCFS